MKTVEFKLPRQRTAGEFVAYPYKHDGRYMIQSDNHCIILLEEEGIMLVSKRFAQYPRFESCLVENGSKIVSLNTELLDAVKGII